MRVHALTHFLFPHPVRLSRLVPLKNKNTEKERRMKTEAVDSSSKEKQACEWVNLVVVCVPWEYSEVVLSWLLRCSLFLVYPFLYNWIPFPFFHAPFIDVFYARYNFDRDWIGRSTGDCAQFPSQPSHPFSFFLLSISPAFWRELDLLLRKKRKIAYPFS